MTDGGVRVVQVTGYFPIFDICNRRRVMAPGRFVPRPAMNQEYPDAWPLRQPLRAPIATNN
jgi:hypothetical protein